jgi:uncharacterized protein involved in exopolysaccharide biosynthesis
MDDEIDLRPYVHTLFNRWWQIALLAFIAAAAALIISVSQTRKYEAIATLLLTRSRATLSLAEQFPTVSEPIDSASRISAVLTIAQTDAIAESVLQTFKDRLPEKWQELQDFKELVKIDSKGDAILISAEADNPEMAAEIANTWAREASLSVNQAYRGEQPLYEIQTQREAAQNEYLSAQNALESFIQNNQIDTLSKQLEESWTLFTEISNDRAWQITYYNNRVQKMQMLITQAEALKDQLERGNRSGAGDLGDALAVLDARSSSLGITNTVATMDLQLTDFSALLDTNANYVADLNAIIEQAKVEKAKAEANLQSLTDAVLQKEQSGPVIEIAATIRDLNTQLEKEKARQLELTNDRDLSLKAYQTLLQKETEIKSSPQVSNVVTVTSQAIPPQKPTPRGTVRNVLIGGVLGFIIGVLGVLLVEWWRSAETTQPKVASTLTSMDAGDD